MPPEAPGSATLRSQPRCVPQGPSLPGSRSTIFAARQLLPPNAYLMTAIILISTPKPGDGSSFSLCRAGERLEGQPALVPVPSSLSLLSLVTQTLPGR